MSKLTRTTVLRSPMTWILIPVTLVIFVAIILSPLLDILPPAARITQALYRFSGFIVNDHDINVYYQRGAWALDGTLPYRDYYAEYPPLAIFVFGIPFLLSRVISLPDSSMAYRTFYILLMCGVGWATVQCMSMLYQMIITPQRIDVASSHDNKVSTVRRSYQSLKERPWLYILFAPASIFFTYNRFDILSSLVILASLVLFCKDNMRWAWILLSISFCIKWYAVLLVPIYASYYYHRADFENKELLISIALAAIAALVIHLPVFVYGGLGSVAFPYIVHISRGTNSQSFLALVQRGLHLNDITALKWIFLALQFCFAGIALIRPIRTKQQVLYWSIAAIAWFIFFAKFQSPQWILWLTPLMLAGLHPASRAQFSLFVLYESHTYLYFPILFIYARSSFPQILIVQYLVVAAIGLYYSGLALRKAQ